MDEDPKKKDLPYTFEGKGIATALITQVVKRTPDSVFCLSNFSPKILQRVPDFAGTLVIILCFLCAAISIILFREKGQSVPINVMAPVIIVCDSVIHFYFTVAYAHIVTLDGGSRGGWYLKHVHILQK